MLIRGAEPAAGILPNYFVNDEISTKLVKSIQFPTKHSFYEKFLIIKMNL